MDIAEIMKRHYLILIFILLVSLFFRSYQIVERFEFAHDGDLYSWIVKDIVVNHHFRLIGQLTSAPGIFIGPFFYYILVPFFLLFKMDPVGTLVPLTIIGVLTTLSYYLVFSKLFNKNLGLIASFLQAASTELTYFDRSIVPSTPTNIWAIWYFYTIISITRGNYSALPLLGLLIGLIWHIHIALLPALIAIPAAMIISKKLPNFSQIKYFLITFITFSLPLIIFEIKHHFIQIPAFMKNFIVNHGGETGLYKYNHLIIPKLAKNIYLIFFHSNFLSFLNHPFLIYSLLAIPLFLIPKKILKLKELLVLYIWIAGVLIFYTFSTTILSEYYLDNLNPIFIGIVSLLIYLLYKVKFIGRILLIIILGSFLIMNLNLLFSDIYHKGYVERKTAVDYIYQDAMKKGFPCIGISYITVYIPGGLVSIGENVGFRYFFYLKKIHLVHPSVEVPVYNIAIPEELSKESSKQKFGHIGVIPPANIPPKETINKSCQTPNTNLTDPMLGYVD